jgi:hypothetical protein
MVFIPSFMMIGSGIQAFTTSIISEAAVLVLMMGVI